MSEKINDIKHTPPMQEGIVKAMQENVTEMVSNGAMIKILNIAREANEKPFSNAYDELTYVRNELDILLNSENEMTEEVENKKSKQNNQHQ